MNEKVKIFFANAQHGYNDEKSLQGIEDKINQWMKTTAWLKITRIESAGQQGGTSLFIFYTDTAPDAPAKSDM